MKVGIVRCQQSEDLCPCNTDFKVVAEGLKGFEKTGPVAVKGLVFWATGVEVTP